jgi:hypothetical protein
VFLLLKDPTFKIEDYFFYYLNTHACLFHFWRLKKSNLEQVLNSMHVSFQHNQKTNLFIHEFGDSGHSCSSKGGYSLEANKNF